MVGIVGDVHGEFGALVELVERASMEVDRLVFVGDYVNRGRRSAEVIQYLVELAAGEGTPVFLAGNHDLAFRDALSGSFDRFLQMGGAATIRSYVSPPFSDVEQQFIDAVPATHRAFLKALASEFVSGDLHVAHQPPAAPLKGRFGVYGHVPQENGFPAVTETAAWIDTGCGMWPGGGLTCFVWPTKTWFQAGRRGLN